MQQNTDSTPSLLHICQSGDIGLLESYTARRYALNMDFFSSLNHKLFAKLKAPIKQYNLYLHHQDLNIIDVHSKIFVYPVQEHNNAPKHMMIDKDF